MNVGLAWNNMAKLFERPLVAKVVLHKNIADPYYENWRNATRRLLRAVDIERPFWHRLANQSSQLSFLIHNSPIPPKHPISEKILSSEIREASYRQPAASQVQELLDGFWADLALLRTCETSPYINWLCRERSFDRSSAVVIVARPDWVLPVWNLIRPNPNLRGLRVYDLSVLADLIVFERVFACGAVVLYPTSLFCCGRASEVSWAIFDWMKTALPPRGPSLYEEERDPIITHLISTEPIINTAMESLTDKDLDPTGLWDQSPADSSVRCNSGELNGYDSVPAIELLLANGTRTYAPLGERVQIATAGDSTQPGSIWLDTKFGASLIPDDFVILRNHGDEDVIVKIANIILKDNAAALRAKQVAWKNALVQLRASYSMEEIVNALQQNGSTVADQQNLRNWMSPRHIKTNNKDDFMAIMKVIGMEGDGNNIWNQMRTINRAHIRAGMVLKRQLTETLRMHSGSELLASGRLDVTIPDLGDESLSAIRIERKLGEVNVRTSQLLRIFEPWQR